MPRNNIYIQLDYDDYKRLEDQLKNWDKIETSHMNDSHYHKALRLEISKDLVFEFQGPLVKKPIESDLDYRTKIRQLCEDMIKSQEVYWKTGKLDPLVKKPIETEFEQLTEEYKMKEGLVKKHTAGWVDWKTGALV